MKSPIFIISGTPGSSKSSVSVALMQRFKFGLHIPIDDLREWVVSGVAQPVPKTTPESDRQFALARRSAAQLASTYAKAGFAVAIDDVIDPENAKNLIEHALSPLPVYKVLLRPQLQEALRRNAKRVNKAFDTSILIEVIERIYTEQDAKAYQDERWLIMNSGGHTIDETVDNILTHFNLHSFASAPAL